jgi:hypothetical protein
VRTTLQVGRDVLTLAATMLVARMAIAESGEPYAHRRSIEVSSGFARLELPDDVLDACRPGLADLRIVDGDGKDVPYASGPFPEPRLRWPPRDVERAPNAETTAIVDRGARPVTIDAVTLGIEGSDFLKPVLVEASEDRANWKEIGRASIFATTAVTMTRISFAANDRRYLRLRLDDRNSEPITVTSITGHAQEPDAGPSRSIRLTASPAAGVVPETDTYSVELPAAHLELAGLRLESASPAFARDVRVYDRIVHRGEVSRRLVGARRLTRAATGPEDIVVPIAGLTGRTLEVEIARVGQSLADVAFIALVRPTFVVFRATAGLVLAYGSPSVRAPKYDLAEALALGPPREFAVASLGPDMVEAGARSASDFGFVVRRGASVDPAEWRVRRRIDLPSAGPLAFVAVDDRAEQLASLRIVDGENRQVPYLTEREPRLRLSPAQFSQPKGEPSSDATSTLRVTGFDPTRAADAIELDAREPFFDREVWIEETAPRRRDRPDLVDAPRRRLGGARWVRMPEQSDPLHVPIAQPSEGELFVTFRDGAERPLTIERVAIERVERRLDFLYAPTDALSLLSGSPSAPSPSYDLALIADRIAELPAEVASLGPPQTVSAPRRSPASRWLWVAVLAAALGVTALLVRTLRATATTDRDPPAP